MYFIIDNSYGSGFGPNAFTWRAITEEIVDPTEYNSNSSKEEKLLREICPNCLFCSSNVTPKFRGIAYAVTGVIKAMRNLNEKCFPTMVMPQIHSKKGECIFREHLEV